MKSNIRFAFAGILAIVVGITVAVFVLGDTVQVETPGGTIELKILEISK